MGSKIWCEVGGGTIPSTCVGCVRPSQRTLNRSDAQSFMQKLHAYSHIKKLIKRDNKAERAGLEDDDTRALQLALANNFVTSLTSLVVTTAQNGTTLASLGNEIAPDFPSRRSYGSGRSRMAGGNLGSGIKMASAPASFPTAVLKGGVSYVSHYSANVLNSPISSGGSQNWRQQLRDRQIFARRRGSSSSGLDLSIGGGGGTWSSRSSSSSSSSRGSIMTSSNRVGGGVISSGALGG